MSLSDRILKAETKEELKRIQEEASQYKFASSRTKRKWEKLFASKNVRPARMLSI